LVETPAPTLGEDFEPTLTAVTPTSTGTLSPLPDGPYAEQRIQLMNTSGAIVTDPLEAPALPNFPYVTIRALSAKPVLELIEYRQLLGNVHRYAAGTDTSVTTTYTYGVSSTQSSSFTSTVGASATASVGFGPAKVSATVSTQFSSTTSSSMDIQSSQSTSTTFTVQAPSTENVVYAEWQLVHELRLALYDPSSPSADEFGYVPYTDPNFAFLASDMAPVYIYEQNQIVPETAFFAN
jgi:flagellar basal body rod protein FlgC